MSNREKSTSVVSPSRISGPGLFCADFVLFTIAYFLCNYLKRGTLELSTGYGGLLMLFYICWFVASFTGRKFEGKSYATCKTGMFCFIKSALYMAYCIAFAIVILDLSDFSRLQVFSTCLVTFILEYIVWSIYCNRHRVQKTDNRRIKIQSPPIERVQYEKVISIYAAIGKSQILS